MANGTKTHAPVRYIGVDVGGTKILAVLAKRGGNVLARKRCPTPRKNAEATVRAIIELVEELLDDQEITTESIGAIGIGVPGVVDTERGAITFAPNLAIADVPIVARLEECFGQPVALGNDVNCGTLGEKWLGSASAADSAVSMFIGTGIGGGIIQNHRLITGAREAAGEIGHVRMRATGPTCGCGQRGCFEALASRTAIERDIRQAIAKGRKTILTEMLCGDMSKIKSGALRKAIEADDPLVKKVLADASRVIGEMCLNIRHLLDPDVILLGGGVIEACSEYMIPIMEQALAKDTLPGAGPGCRIVVSSLGDDAVPLGAVALSQETIGKNPLAKLAAPVDYPKVENLHVGQVDVDGQTYQRDVYIRADGKIKPRDNALAKARRKGGSAHHVVSSELKKVCKRGPRTLIVGIGHDSQAKVADDAATFCSQRGIELRVLPSPEAVETWNKVRGRKALLLHVTC